MEGLEQTLEDVLSMIEFAACEECSVSGDVCNHEVAFVDHDVLSLGLTQKSERKAHGIN
jgi:hypothetical protein